jgi:hypothetical protein
MLGITSSDVVGRFADMGKVKRRGGSAVIRIFNSSGRD